MNPVMGSTKTKMISLDFLDAIAADLAAYRDGGRGDILYDTRDQGNYSAYSWESTVEMLSKADPTGLSIGMLLHEMVEATIKGSQVKLERVICEPGFLDKISKILSIKGRLLREVEAPMGMLMERINQALAATAGDLGQASTREVAICLRDAIYSIERGLSLRWLECDDTAMKENVPLCNAVSQFKDLAEFTDALRNTLPWGAHLARIGVSNTAIGIKQPGKVAFLSSMSINKYGGGMYENRASGHQMAEKLDLDTAVERYPDWLTISGYKNAGQSVVTTGRETHNLNQLSKLPRDKLIWVAMLVEIASQRMANTSPESVELAENISRALPARESTAQQNLPMVISPNWIASALTIEKALSDLRFTPWELKFFALALAGLSAETFLPYSDEAMVLDIQTRELTVAPKHVPSFEHEWHARNVKITTMQTDWVGTRAETEKARKFIFEKNLAVYLLTWGNFQFDHAWESNKEWFKQKLVANLDGALRSSCAKLAAANYAAYKGVHLYSQSPKHKTYNARCYFNPKKLVTHVARFAPQCDKDIIEMLGLHSDQELPEFLRGWSRAQGWTTSDLVKERGPVDINDRWDFCRQQNHILEASLCFNETSLPADPQRTLLNNSREAIHG